MIEIGQKVTCSYKGEEKITGEVIFINSKRNIASFKTEKYGEIFFHKNPFDGKYYTALGYPVTIEKK